MATADTDKKEIQSFIESLLDPKPIDSLETLGEVKILLYDSPLNPPREIYLRSIYPFMTILDLKIAIYDHLKMDDRALPEFLFLGKQVLPGNKISAVEYNWTLSESPTQPVTLFEPLRLSSKFPVDSRFVESSGNRQNIGLTETDRVTLEDKFLNSIGKIPVLRAYMYSTVLNSIPGPKPVSELDWNGRLYPYFPKLSVGNDIPTNQQRNNAKRLLKGFIRKRQFFMKLNAIMTGGDPIYYIGLKGVLSMLLTFTRPETISGIETVFYTIPVNDRRPYMRLLPVEGEPISKIHMIGSIPNIHDPNLLHQWSQDYNPTPERDFALVKILIRKAIGNVRPLYCTMRLYDDGTSDITIDPPKGEIKLTPDTDLEALPIGIVSALEDFPYIRQMPVLSSGKFVFDVNLKDIIVAKYTSEGLRNKLPIFSAIFQEIQPIPGENPTIMLRYKLVTNFYREDRIQTFITQVQTRKSSKGDTFISDLPDLVAEEFQISRDKARTYVEKKLQGTSDIIMTNPETREYALNNNPGIDIAVFAEKHPIYSFKIYNVNSYINLQRIITFLSLLMSRSEQEFKVPIEHVEDIESAEQEKEEEEEEEEEEEKEEEKETSEEDGFENVPEEDGFENVPEEDGFENVPEEDGFENVNNAVEAPDALPDYLFDFANEGMTLQQAYAEEEAQRSAEAEGAALPELGEAVEEQRDHRGLDVLEREVAEETRQSLAEAVPPKKFKIKKEQEKPVAPLIKPIEEDVIRSKGLEKYFSDRLKEADKRLFDFKQSDGSAKTKYVVQCASNLMRQPAVLNEGEFERMKDEYKDVLDSGEITFFLFPLDKDKKKAGYNPDPKKEHYNIMRYGSSPKVQNYYICCKFFCIRDVIMVREKEFLGTKLRRPVKRSDGTIRTTKEPNTCPFCEGLLVKNKRFPGTNEVVLERKPNTGAGRHLYIRFLKKTNHPEGLYLPCCFLEDQPIRIGQHPAYPEPSEDIYSAIAAPEIGDDDNEEVKEETTFMDETTVLEKISVPYETTLLTARTASIVGSEKLPLDPAVKMLRKTLRPNRITGKYIDLEESGKALAPIITPPQIGLLPPLLNEYFQQQTTDIVSRTFNPQKLTPGSRGFLRIGVQNGQHYRNDSFLAATAIYFFKMDSVQEFKDLLIDIIQPRVFLALNYGNLALEMYDPMWIPRTINQNPKGLPANNEQIKNWAYDFLGIRKRTQKNSDLLKRAFLAYDKFRWWLSSDKTKKEYRHFAHLFSLPGLMNIGKRSYAMDSSKMAEYRRPGVIFIILEITQSGELKVRCPAYPIQNEVFATSDIGFLFHHYSGIWEPIFYYDNKALLDGELNQSYLTFSGWKEEGLTEEKFPPIIRRRIDEFRSQCSSKKGGLGIYTSSAGIKSTRIVPLSTIKKVLGKNPEIQMYGFIRDSYNHISALVFRTDTIGLVAVPVIDDGLSFIDLEYKLIMDWDDYDPAPIDQVYAFYRKYVETLFPVLYTIDTAVINRGTGRVEAVQLRNGLYIPVANTQDVPDTLVFPDPESPRIIDEMEWSINKKIAIDSTSNREKLESISKLRLKEFNESFEYLRITFSNWLNSHEDGGNFRNELEEIIFSRDYALFEKRKRLEIILGPIIEFWIAEKNEDAPRQISILRKDCTLLSEKDCGGMCSWVSEKGKCLIHVSKGGEEVPGGQILLRRLIEELLRFGNRRKQIFNKTVLKIAVLDKPILENDQYIIPEGSDVWTEMLRKDWSKPEEDAPRYLEEMTQEPSRNIESEMAPLTDETILPVSVSTILNPSNSDLVFPRLRFYPSPTGKLDPFLALMKTSSQAIDLEPGAIKLDDRTIKNLVRAVQIPIMQINLQEESTRQILSRRTPRDRFRKYAIFVIKEDGTPGLIVTDPEAPALLESADLTEETKKIFEDKLRTRVIFVAGQA